MSQDNGVRCVRGKIVLEEIINNRLSNVKTMQRRHIRLTTSGMLMVLTISTSGSPADFSGTKTKVLGFRA